MEIINGRLRMIGDNLLLRPLPWDTATTVVAIRHGRDVRGEVLAVGPGRHHIRYSDGRRKMAYSRHYRPTDVQVGDIVELGGLNIFDGHGYQFTEVLYNGERCLICTERDVAVARTAEAVGWDANGSQVQ